MYNELLIGDLLPKLINRFGYGRVPILIREEMIRLTAYFRVNNVFHFWMSDVGPNPDVNADRTIEDERRDAPLPISDSENDDN